MKKVMIIVILITIGLQYGKSQNDTILQGEGQVTQSDEKYDRVYKLFVEDRDREIKHLWKLNLVDIGLLQPNIGFEQKIFRSISTETYLGIGRLGWYGLEGFEFQSEFEQQFKYYYNLKSRESKGKRINGFSGNYFSVAGFASYTVEQNEKPVRTQTDYFTGYSTGPKVFTLKYGVILKYGLQRRIGNIGYFDICAGVRFYEFENTFEYENYYPDSGQAWMPFIKIRAGFAIDSFKNLKRMLK